MVTSFWEWLKQRKDEMAARTFTHWGDDPIGTVKNAQGQAEKDWIGVPRMAHPGFREGDKKQIIKGKDQVEVFLNKATSRLGINWVVTYIEPAGDMEQGPKDWPRYQQYSQQIAQQDFDKFQKEYPANANQQGETQVMPPPNPNNTIVYIKPTSRVHTLTPWQQMHNIGHAVWTHCADKRQEFEQRLVEIVGRLQKQAYDSSGEAPSHAEITVTLGRLLDVQSFQRLFAADKPFLGPGDLDKPNVATMTALNTFDEAMFEMIATFLRNGGHLPLKGRGPTPGGQGKVKTMDRRGEMTPNPEIQRKYQTRQWAWQPLAGNDQQWAEAAKELEAVVVEALKNCVWAAVGGPIYATSGTITTEP